VFASPRAKRPRRPLPDRLTLSSSLLYAIAFIARTLLPASFTHGEEPTIAILPGTIATMPPPTPVLGGQPGSIGPQPRLVVEEAPSIYISRS